MFRILKKENLAPNIFLMDVEAPRIATQYRSYSRWSAERHRECLSSMKATASTIS